MSINRGLLTVWVVFSLVFLIALLTSNKAFAFQLTPTVSVIDLPEDASGVTVNLYNPRNVALPVELEIVERLVHEDGSEDYSAADGQFLVFPPQAVIPPGQTQAIRLQWVDKAPQTSRSFTLFAQEIAVDLTGKDKPTLQTLLRMGASVHVASTASRPDVAIAGIAETKKGAQVTLKNSGDRFIYLNDVELKFESNAYTGSSLADIAGRTLLPPSGKRTILIPNEKGRPEVSIPK